MYYFLKVLLKKSLAIKVRGNNKTLINQVNFWKLHLTWRVNDVNAGYHDLKWEWGSSIYASSAPSDHPSACQPCCQPSAKLWWPKKGKQSPVMQLQVFTECFLEFCVLTFLELGLLGIKPIISKQTALFCMTITRTQNGIWFWQTALGVSLPLSCSKITQGKFVCSFAYSKPV